jgi:diadenosine tetraphosphate (Ap4A) HIT family hydrolase
LERQGARRRAPRLKGIPAMNETIRKFGYPDSLIREYRHWVVLLRPQQVTLGSLILASKEPATEFHQLSPDGFAELRTAVADIERALKDLTSYQKINYLMLMMVDPDVHFHVIPRYQQAARFDGVEFPDHGWPGPPALTRFTATDADGTGAISTRLRALWPVEPGDPDLG